MKRDWSVIRELLLEVEKHDEVRIPYSPDETRSYHGELLIKAGFVGDGNSANYTFLHGLTWAGHDLLDAIRDDAVWTETKSRLAKVSGSVSLEVVKALAVNVAKGMLGIGQELDTTTCIAL